MKYISLFSGIEAASVAWGPLGFEPVAFSEIDPFPKAVLAAHYPDVPDLGDITKIDWREYAGKADLIVGGSPCFPAGTLVLTSKRLTPIEDVREGDLVLTHRNRWRRVLRTGSKIADTIILKGQGSVGVECTPNHPFYSAKKVPVWDNDKRTYKRQLDKPAWVNAENMQGRMWLNLNGATDALPIPMPENTELTRVGFSFSECFFYFVGRWLGDGWANVHKRNGRVNSLMKRVYVCCAHNLADDLEEKLSHTGLHFGRNDERTTTRFTCSSTALYDWIVGNFGVHADGKNIPAWVFGMKSEWRKSLLTGYLESDGNLVPNGYRTVSISKSLTIGMKMLAAGFGYASSVVLSKPSRKHCIIEGREVHENPFYQQTYYTNSRSAVVTYEGYWGLVRKIKDCRKNVTVYNLEVEDDNSYTADAIAVHNCQSFSVAGSRTGLDGASGLMWEYVRAVQEIRPEWFVWENVPGALSSSHGEDFRCLLESMDELGYGLAWRVLDAQFFGVPQRRRRVFLIGHLGDQRAAEVLFEPESLRWDTPSSREKRQALTGRTENRARTAGKSISWNRTDGRCRYPDDTSLVQTLSAHMGTGGDNVPPVYVRDGSCLTYCASDSVSNSSVDLGLAPTLTVHDSKSASYVSPGNGSVRRLTPIECEWLQGFPDGWTDIPWRGSEHAPDSCRYKALGNSMAVPVVRWIGRRIKEVISCSHHS